ncbi:hypothetical protein [Elioraea rosea]|uniref:hypothetical protein n=1 Tax=Elioraea rosea TaxID=2492390 RepID=UPI001182E3D6|nr:hypothetical protein [Elioraea rosea]
MRQNTTIPVDVRLAMLRDAVAMLDPRRNPGTRAEAAAVLCESLVAEGARANNRRLIAEALMLAAETVAEQPLPAVARGALLDAMRDAAGLLTDRYEEEMTAAFGLAAASPQKQRRRPAVRTAR